MSLTDEQKETNLCRAAALIHGAATLERKAKVMLEEAAEYRALAERLKLKANG